MNPWDAVLPPWQAAFEEAWAAYCAGSLPIGAAVTTAHGAILARGRNRPFDAGLDGDPAQLRNHILGHAETNAFVSLGNYLQHQRGPADAGVEYTLYSTLEPCLLCTGAAVIAGVRTIEFLIPDPLGGATDALDATPRMRRRKIQVMRSGDAILGNIAIAMLAVSQLQDTIASPTEREIEIAQELARGGFTSGLNLAKQLVQSQELAYLRCQHVPAMIVVNRLAQLLGYNSP